MTVNTKAHDADGQISAIILAAGKGTRMKSSVPKVLHPVMGKTMVEWVISIARKAGATDMTLVLSSDTAPFEPLLRRESGLRITVQKQQRGTGDAVASAAAAYSKAKKPEWAESVLVSGAPSQASWVLICAGDTPAMSSQTIREFIQGTMTSGKRLGVLGMRVEEPRGYGRLLRDSNGGLLRIVEEKDAEAGEKAINLVNTGVIFGEVSWLFGLLNGLSPNNAQNEFYLTDIFAASVARGESAYVFETTAGEQFAGVNDRAQLEQVERGMMRAKIRELMSHGVSVHLPETVYIEGDVVVEADSRIFPGVCLKGKTRVSRNCMIGPHAVLEDALVGAGTTIGAHAVITRSTVAAGQTVAPLSSYADTEF
jgi:bifunctional UDP-N-acetylglucosamine pyrophosphorylase/glucosamine-1-phosphate N-acetyltransferase